ncbi:MAG: hypothetical protein A4S14_16190 [Proteobacteria bacterium SG_bin9]|nr:MAG: hypothetical protein A4S14_16190 [Proteobacteria bacterium SG_bin9]
MRKLFALAFLFVATVAPASAERRVALVIGNSSYEHVARLANPANDADAIAATFRNAGFDVIEAKRDVKYNETRRLLRDFNDKTRDADIAVVYYAGHGIEVDGTNYVIPVDAVLERDIDVYDEAIALDRLLVSIEPAKKLRLVILDACRDNPFAKTMKRTTSTRAIGRGLGRVEPNSPNTLIAFAAKAGSTASDGDSKNSPFTAALVKYIATPGLDLRKAFGFIRDDVMKVTLNRQEPFVYGSLGGNDVSLVPAPPQQTPAANILDGVRRDYEFAERAGSIEAWDSFTRNNPSGFFYDLAVAQRRKLLAEAARIEATEKARRAEEDKARLASEQAAKKEQDEAAARAKAAEAARIAAEKVKRDEELKVAAAEKAKTEAQARIAEQERRAAEKARQDEERAAAARAAAEKAAAEKAAAAKAAADKAAADKAVAEKAAAEKLEAAKAAADKATADKAAAEKAAAEKAAADKAQKETQVAALTPPASPAPKAESINRQLQTELRRVGCYTASLNDDWGNAAQRSLDQFNKRAGSKLDVKTASLDSLDAVRGKTSRVCPLVCNHGYRAEGEKCVEIVCKAGFEVGDNNTCERVEPKKKPPPPVAKRDEAPPAAKPKAAESAKPAPAGQIHCTRDGCQAVPKNCRIVAGSTGMGPGLFSPSGQLVCN